MKNSSGLRLHCRAAARRLSFTAKSGRASRRSHKNHAMKIIFTSGRASRRSQQKEKNQPNN